MTRPNIIRASEISEQDAKVSLSSLRRLRPYITGNERSMVFFIGAGASSAGATGMPGAQALINRLLVDALNYSVINQQNRDKILPALQEVSWRIGFEITLNEFWQICRDNVVKIFEALANLEKQCNTNNVHKFLAYWLTSGGTVLTTNYDCLIEKEGNQSFDESIPSRYRETGHDSFDHWREDLNQGGRLFKLHGSLEAPESCLGALEHVGTNLNGKKAELLKYIVCSRPLCFVGWSGKDPDIPPVLQESLEQRSRSLPIFWLHYEEGKDNGPASLRATIDRVSPQTRFFAKDNPILTEADRALKGVLTKWLNITAKESHSRPNVVLDFSDVVNECSRSGMLRMVGIALRKGNKHKEAARAFEAAKQKAQSAAEKAAAMQEKALLHQQKEGGETKISRNILNKARESMKQDKDPWQNVNISFGMLSMTITNLPSKPWLLFKIPGLFRKYRASIEKLRNETADKESITLHEALLHLYKGRLRYKMFGWLAMLVPVIGDWIIKPFDTAKVYITKAGDIHISSEIQVLAYRAIVLARLGRCRKLTDEISEIDRLVSISLGTIKDNAEITHWQKQKREIKRRCRGRGEN